MSKKNRVILGFGISLVFLGIIFYAFTTPTRPPDPSVATQSLLSGTPSLPLPPVTPSPLLPPITPPPFKLSVATQRSAEEKLSLGLHQGDRLIYDFFQHRSIKVAANASMTSMTTSSAAPTFFDLTVKQRGEFIVSVYSEDDKGWTVGFQLMEARIESPDTQTDNLSNEMSGEIMAVVLKSGRISKLSNFSKVC